MGNIVYNSYRRLKPVFENEFWWLLCHEMLIKIRWEYNAFSQLNQILLILQCIWIALHVEVKKKVEHIRFYLCFISNISNIWKLMRQTGCD